MTILWQELRRGRRSTLLWSAALAGMLAVCALVFPVLKDQMAELEQALMQMGELMEAFGASAGFRSFTDYIAVEGESILGLGGAIFAALLGSAALSREEREHTAEFLLTHPVSRLRVVMEKLLSVVLQIVLLNVIVAVGLYLSAWIAGEELTAPAMLPSYLLLQLEVGCLTYGFSAFLVRGSTGLGIGVAAGCYFLNILANVTEEARFLLWITPFGYAGIEPEWKYLSVGLPLAVVAVLLGTFRFMKKDILN